MVFFTCGKCNESLKKNKVAQHFVGRCSDASYVSCVDCSVEFYGDDYASHTSCVSEAQKYGGKNWTPIGQNREGAKQAEWTMMLQKARDIPTDDPKLKQLLESLVEYPNVPRKKPKFINFLKSTFPAFRREDRIMNQVWDILEKIKAEGLQNNQMETENTDPSTKKSSGKKTEEKVSDKFEDTTSSNSKKQRAAIAKKRKTESDPTDEELEELRAAKRLRKQQQQLQQQEKLNDTLEEQEKTPFSWQEVIMKAVVKKGEISLTRLRKKCVSEFVAAGRYMRSEERLWRKLDSQLASLSRAKKLVVKNDKIMLPNRVGADE